MNVNKQPWIKRLSSFLVPQVVERRQGEFTSLLEVVIENGQFRLNTARVNYSFGSLHTLFWKTFTALDIQRRDIKSVLILGLGAGSVANLLTKTFHKDCRMVGVERDKVVLELASKYFHIDRFPNLSIHHADACEFVKTCKERFDLVVVDVFVDDTTPAVFADPGFLEALNDLLSDTGIVCCNRMVNTPESKEQAIRLLHSVDSIIGPDYLFEYNLQGSKNWMIIHERKSLEP
jgi:spermidine synthase